MQIFERLFHKRTIYFILLLCFLLRLILVLSVDPLGDDTVDGFDYHRHALSLLNGEGYPLQGSLPFIRPPLYPFLLSVVYFFVGHETLLTARLSNVVLDTLACFVFYKLVLLVWNNKPTAILAGLVYAVNPFYLFFNLRVRVEALFILLIATGIYFLIREYKKGFPATSAVFLIGGVFGLACLCRSNAASVAIFVPLWLIYCNLKTLKKGILLGFVFVFGCALIIAPWSLRNYHTYGEMVIITDGFGYIFWISNTDLRLIDAKAKTYAEYIEADKIVWQRTAEVEQKIQGQSIKQRDSHYFNLGVEYIRHNFSTWLGLSVSKFVEFWSPMARLDMQGSKAFLTLPFGLLMLFGMFFYFKSFFSQDFDTNIWLLFAILIVGSTLSGVMMWSTIRYRVPTIDAYIIPFFLFWLQKKFLKLPRGEDAIGQ